jgi:hypothetical protein
MYFGIKANKIFVCYYQGSVCYYQGSAYYNQEKDLLV